MSEAELAGPLFHCSGNHLGHLGHMLLNSYVQSGHFVYDYLKVIIS